MPTPSGSNGSWLPLGKDPAPITAPTRRDRLRLPVHPVLVTCVYPTFFRESLMTTQPIDKPEQQALAWTVNEDFPVGKGASVQEFVAVAGENRYVIDVAPWGEGRFTVDNREVARVDGSNDMQKTFRDLSILAERHLRGERIEVPTPARSPLIPAAKAKLLAGKRGLIVGIANESSIAWGCARAFRALGADIAVT